MSGVRERRRLQTRGALLEAAAELFAERGLEGASVEAIAARAGFTKGAFYASFDSKEGLVLELLDERFEAELARLADALEAGAEPARAASRSGSRALAAFRADPEWSRLYFELAAHAMRNERLRERLVERMRELRRRIAATYATWAERSGLEPALGFEQMAAMAQAMTDGFFLAELIDPELDPALYPRMLELFARGVESEPPDPGPGS